MFTSWMSTAAKHATSTIASHRIRLPISPGPLLSSRPRRRGGGRGAGRAVALCRTCPASREPLRRAELRVEVVHVTAGRSEGRLLLVPLHRCDGEREDLCGRDRGHLHELRFEPKETSRPAVVHGEVVVVDADVPVVHRVPTDEVEGTGHDGREKDEEEDDPERDHPRDACHPLTSPALLPVRLPA